MRDIALRDTDIYGVSGAGYQAQGIFRGDRSGTNFFTFLIIEQKFYKKSTKIYQIRGKNLPKSASTNFLLNQTKYKAKINGKFCFGNFDPQHPVKGD